MVISYKCKNPNCRQYNTEVPDIQTLRTDDGKGRICKAYQSRMVIGETVNVSWGSGWRGGGRRASTR